MNDQLKRLSPDDITQMHNRVLNNFNQMLLDRGYTGQVTFDEEFQIINSNVLVCMLIHDNLDSKKATSVIKEMEKRKLSHSIIVCGSKNKTVDKVVSYDTIDPKYTVEIFEKNTLLINITKHVLVPKHRILNDTERQELFERYHIQDNSQLPKMTTVDPIARYYGLKKGQVVEITRNEDINKHISYRIVV
jgi:DNA-directed RNA polymerase subunit H (RpoH/RPB5)